MGKIVKYCSSCEESFSERFGFCPNCAAPLQAFEMNPLHAVTTSDSDPIDTSPVMDDPVVPAASIPAAEEHVTPMAAAVDPMATVPSMNMEEDRLIDAEADHDIRREHQFSEASGDTIRTEPIEIHNADVREDVPVAKAATAAGAGIMGSSFGPTTIEGHAANDTPVDAYAGTHNYAPGYHRSDDGGYYITVIQEKNGKQRNMLLLGALVFMVAIALGSYVISIFQKDMFVGAIGDDRSLAYLIEDVPIVEEEAPKPKLDKEDGGGGGGGGKNDPKPVNQGDLPDQTPNPIRPPDPKVPRLSNPELVLPPPSTQGNVKTEKKYGQWGDPNSRFSDLSSGPGSGGGMGTGVGTGAGSGRGTGMGSGSGSGSGGGSGDGNGDGSGSGGLRDARNPPPPPPAGVTSPLRIISTPKATYTEAARKNNVQGSVLVRVTLLASGQVGNVTVVRGLPDGLNEKAIAAARMIRFEPKKVNGVPVPVTKTLEFTFSIY